MRRISSRGLLVVVFVCLLLSSPLALADDPLASGPGTSYPNTSWALGIVVPEGSGLNNGTGLHWESVNNVTVLVSLPNITSPDRVVYSILSVMTSDGGVMQVAAGMYPNRSAWLTYSWLIPNAAAVTPNYIWILNGSAPDMNQNAGISMSIFRDFGSWNLRVTDYGTGGSVVRRFPEGLASSLKVGDQEVFALESYSRTSSTFRGMGNLTLEGLLVNGEKVTEGFYAYGDWDPNRNPLFAVGTSGTAPPVFISLGEDGKGSFAWGFSELWQGQAFDYGQSVTTAVLVAALLLVAVLFLVAVRVARRGRDT